MNKEAWVGIALCAILGIGIALASSLFFADRQTETQNQNRDLIVDSSIEKQPEPIESTVRTWSDRLIGCLETVAENYGSEEAVKLCNSVEKNLRDWKKKEMERPD